MLVYLISLICNFSPVLMLLALVILSKVKNKYLSAYLKMFKSLFTFSCLFLWLLFVSLSNTQPLLQSLLSMVEFRVVFHKMPINK